MGIFLWIEVMMDMKTQGPVDREKSLSAN